jgi:hypothetical protein
LVEPNAISLWHSHQTNAAIHRRSLAINGPVFKNVWTQIYKFHIKYNYQDPYCYVEGLHLIMFVRYNKSSSPRLVAAV